jgi:hypothetical protein
MASTDDILTAIRGAVQNLSNLTYATGAAGRFTSSAISPIATMTTVGTSALTIVAANPSRRAISFHSCDPTGNTTIWLLPGVATAITAQGGVVLVPGQDYVIDQGLGSNAAWQAIAGTGSSNNLLILEYV